jgi:hypothetical protein
MAVDPATGPRMDKKSSRNEAERIKSLALLAIVETVKKNPPCFPRGAQPST